LADFAVAVGLVRLQPVDALLAALDLLAQQSVLFFNEPDLIAFLKRRRDSGRTSQMSGHADGDETKERNYSQALKQSSHNVLQFSL
jgi:hypothetical protein